MKNKISPFAASIAAGLEEAIMHAKGEYVPGVRVTEVPDVKSIRTKLGMTQEQFAATYHISAGTVKGWEQKGAALIRPQPLYYVRSKVTPNKFAMRRESERNLPQRLSELFG